MNNVCFPFSTHFFISQTLVIGIVLCVVSVAFPAVFGRGLLPPAIIMAYNAYLTFSAITNNPDAACNPVVNSGGNQNQASIIAGLVIAVVSVTWTAMSSAGSIYSAVSTAIPEEGVEHNVNPAAAHSPRAAAGVAEGSYQQQAAGGGKGAAAAPARDGDGDEEEGAGGAGGKKKEPPAAAAAAAAAESRWKPFTFHLELFLAGCYVAMMASNWGDPAQQNNPDARFQPELSLASMWARMGSQFAIHLLFIWTLIAPAVRAG